MKIVFLTPAWEDYLYWQQHDKGLLKNVNAIIKEIQRCPFNTIFLIGGLEGSVWSTE